MIICPYHLFLLIAIMVLHTAIISDMFILKHNEPKMFLKTNINMLSRFNTVDVLIEKRKTVENKPNYESRFEKITGNEERTHQITGNQIRSKVETVSVITYVVVGIVVVLCSGCCVICFVMLYKNSKKENSYNDQSFNDVVVNDDKINSHLNIKKDMLEHFAIDKEIVLPEDKLEKSFDFNFKSCNSKEYPCFCHENNEIIFKY